MQVVYKLRIGMTAAETIFLQERLDNQSSNVARVPQYKSSRLEANLSPIIATALPAV
jgi:hypothetical protein